MKEYQQPEVPLNMLSESEIDAELLDQGYPTYGACSPGQETVGLLGRLTPDALGEIANSEVM